MSLEVTDLAPVGHGIERPEQFFGDRSKSATQDTNE